MAAELDVVRLSRAAGVEIKGLDLADEQSAETVAAIRSLLAEHGVVLFRDQTMSPDQHVRFSSSFGPLEIEVTGNLPGDGDDLPPGMSVIKYRIGRPRAGEIWHSDLSNAVVPAAISILHAQCIPDIGGDTMFANMYLAYDSLSVGMKELLRHLNGVHTMYGQGSMTDDPDRQAELLRSPPVVHPLVRRHPLTGRPFLYVSQRVVFIEGMTREESAPILSFLCARSVAPEFVYRHVWRSNDVLMWDNRVVSHMALGDYDLLGEDRWLLRTAILDGESGRVYAAG